MMLRDRRHSISQLKLAGLITGISATLVVPFFSALAAENLPFGLRWGMPKSEVERRVGVSATYFMKPGYSGWADVYKDSVIFAGYEGRFEVHYESRFGIFSEGKLSKFAFFFLKPNWDRVRADPTYGPQLTETCYQTTSAINRMIGVLPTAHDGSRHWESQWTRATLLVPMGDWGCAVYFEDVRGNFPQ